MLKTRVITAVILTAVFIGALFFAPSIIFQALVLTMFAAAAWEWSNLAGLSSLPLRLSYSALLVIATAICFWALQQFALWQSFFIGATIWWTIALLWVQGYPSSAVFWQSRLARLLLGFLVLIPSAVAVVKIHQSPQGQALVLSLLLIVAAADTGAYFSGKAFGARKLAPNVSPGKSWEGAFGGLLLVAVIAACCGIWLLDHWYIALAIALPVAMASILGDLLESMLKRHRGIKDSGWILPGHGGVLDRIDGITAAAPVFALGLLASGWVL